MSVQLPSVSVAKQMLPISTMAQSIALPSWSVIWDLYVAHSVGEENEYFVKVAIIKLLSQCKIGLIWVLGKVPFVG